MRLASLWSTRYSGFAATRETSKPFADGACRIMREQAVLYSTSCSRTGRWTGPVDGSMGLADGRAWKPRLPPRTVARTGENTEFRSAGFTGSVYLQRHLCATSATPTSHRQF
ncbi:hypothetical protein G6O67_008232 [Ophiocordyceps sinensis]|uniref:Uncharacterized protein n=1 Tax=Ophiocordyceps sinensis TaxID=72228 RepID=A0A8H4LTW5_9HYPO|nr:hypothetical protein G6O67_008232 [Ophiocordyceps sinensis]